ncbi:unnamed protein product [Ostreobium quekettii]|uniref:Uncharacterized protein n=1 Tax=Ostreobium quekettii TaxID=121088 RepID=A0A8S1J6X2_9CHLO|nr:unnamed protein product [Ostreobium quekettii]
MRTTAVCLALGLVVALAAGGARAELGKCVVVTDFDGVIKIGESEYSNDIKTILPLIKEANVSYGLATASCETEWIKGYLNEVIDNTTYTEEFLESTAAQFCVHEKHWQTDKIVEYFDGDKFCTIVFDDSIGNRVGIVESGYKYHHVDATIGITMQDWQDGLTALQTDPPCYC